MWVVVMTENDNYEGVAFLCKTEKEGKDKLLELYIAEIKKENISEENTYIKKGERYAQISNGLKIKEIRLLSMY